VPPYYARKATGTFRQETFADQKLARHYYSTLARRQRVKPVMFFLGHKRVAGPPNLRAIRDIEGYLINLAEARNSDLSNVQRRENKKGAIHGMTCDCPGKPPDAARMFARMLMGSS
jgi:hypothetical protein